MFSSFSIARLFATSLALACAFAAAPSAAAEPSWPSRPITVVIGYPPGGSVDAVGRAVVETLGKKLEATVVVDNAGGAAGAIGVQKVVNAAPDGYTLILGSSSEFVATRLLNPAQKYDAAKDLAPIGYVGSIPLVLVASRQSGVTSLAQFVDVARKKPGQMSYGTSGIGSMLHFSGELVKKQAGLSIIHIPYRGAGNIGADLAGGAIEFAFLGPGAAKPLVDAGRIVPIAVTSAQRIALMPEVPALGEHPALKGYNLVAWYALMAPRGLTPDTQIQLQRALRETLRDTTVQQKLERVGVVVGRGDEDLSERMANDAIEYQRIVDFAGMKQ
ncbi:Bug family tripartite tricarboxylate transporter substrate binding protein [Variovorax soli]|jgi:tripartite-type tricarboxylate transporter receptor subunit TctC|uniref:Bug family tripartite tricarboxylate transporter substrate binding protein n=1 Tax=Variovorax soli TaxID=376815 RepID=UPI000838033E|nr:tripartite tricarboxylate transporter substrate binding protein [Variovorax soli]